MKQRENERTAQETLYWGLALVGLVAIRQLWTEKLHPWTMGAWGQLRAGELVHLPIVGRVDQADAVGIVVLAMPLLVALGLVVAKIRRWSRAQDPTIGQ